MKKKKRDRGFSLVELIVAIAIIAVLAGVIAPTLYRYVGKARARVDASAMGDFLNQLFLSAAADTTVYFTITDEGTVFESEEDDDTLIICPESDATLYQKSVAEYLGQSSLVFKSPEWKKADIKVKVLPTWDGIKLEYSEDLVDLMGAENLRYR